MRTSSEPAPLIETELTEGHSLNFVCASFNTVIGSAVSFGLSAVELRAMLVHPLTGRKMKTRWPSTVMFECMCWRMAAACGELYGTMAVMIWFLSATSITDSRGMTALAFAGLPKADFFWLQSKGLDAIVVRE